MNNERFHINNFYSGDIGFIAPNLIKNITSLVDEMERCKLLPINKIMNITTYKSQNAITKKYTVYIDLVIKDIIYTNPHYGILSEYHGIHASWSYIISLFISFLVDKAVLLFKVMECMRFRVFFILEYSGYYITIHSDFYQTSTYNHDNFINSMINKIESYTKSANMSEKYSLLKDSLITPGSQNNIKITSVKISSSIGDQSNQDIIVMTNSTNRYYLEEFDKVNFSSSMDINNQAVNNSRIVRNIFFKVDTSFRMLVKNFLSKKWGSYYLSTQTSFYDLFLGIGLAYEVSKEPKFTHRGGIAQFIYDLSYIQYFVDDKTIAYLSYKDYINRSFGFVFSCDGIYYVDSDNNALLLMGDNNEDATVELSSHENYCLVDKQGKINEKLVDFLSSSIEVKFESIDNKSSMDVYETMYVNNLRRFDTPIKMTRKYKNGKVIKGRREMSGYEKGMIDFINSNEMTENNLNVAMGIDNKLLGKKVKADDKMNEMMNRRDQLKNKINNIKNEIELIEDDVKFDKYEGIEFENNEAITNNYNLISKLFGEIKDKKDNTDKKRKMEIDEENNKRIEEEERAVELLAEEELGLTMPEDNEEDEVKEPVEEVKEPVEEAKEPIEEAKEPEDEVKEPVEEVKEPIEEDEEVEEAKEVKEEVKEPVEVKDKKAKRLKLGRRKKEYILKKELKDAEKEYNEIDKKIIEISNAKSRENVKESNNNKNNIVMNMIGKKREPGFIDIFDEEHKNMVKSEKVFINGNGSFISFRSVLYEVYSFKYNYIIQYKAKINGDFGSEKYDRAEDVIISNTSKIYYDLLSKYKQVDIKKNIVFYSSDNKKYIVFTDDHKNVKNVYFVLNNIKVEEEGSIMDVIKRYSGASYDDLFESGGSFKALPDVMSTKMRKCVLNIQNDADNSCFLYCVNAWKMIKDGYKTNDPKRVGQYKNKNFFNLDGVSTENTKFYDIDTFVKNNKINVMVWVIDDSLACSNVYNSNLEYIDNIYLLLYKRHYMLIKNLAKFLEISRDSSSSRKKIYLCELCNLNIEYSEEKMQEHKKYYCNKRVVNEEICEDYELPKNDYVAFRSHNKKVKVGYVVCADFEAILEKFDDNSNIQTLRVSTHVPYAVGYAFMHNDELVNSGNFVGNDCSSKFIDFIDSLTKDIKEAKNDYDNSLSIFTNSFQRCYICDKEISFGIIDKIGNYFHPKCANKYSNSKFKLVILFHNFKNYDSHFLIDAIFNKYKNIFTIPKSKEKYTAIEYIANSVKVRYIDSRSFLPDSLDSLSKKMTSFKFMKDLINKKMAFPYEYIDSWDKLYLDALPSDYDMWSSSLQGAKYTQEEIDYALNDFKERRCKNILDYSVIYMMNDVFLLLEIIYDFKSTMIATYELDPLHYYTLPSYAWDVALKSLEFSIKKIQLVKCRSLISNLMMNMRGGISTVSKRKWLKDDENNSIFYWDANNLYGWAMSQKLPYDDIKEVNIPENYIDFIMKYDMESEYGYFILADLKYTEYHDELPFLPEKYKNRLCATLRDKNFYFCHIMNLKQAMFNGVEVTKVHKIISFKHDYWLRPYIEFNTGLRSASSEESKKNFFKLMNNAVFGKSMENVFKQSKFKPVSKNDFETINKLNGDSKYISSEYYTDNILIFELKKIPIYDKPSYVGFCILELSKYKMYDTFYNGIKKKWPSSCLSYMDTDSFIVNIPIPRNKFSYEGVEEYFDLSVYGEGHEWYSNANKGVLGKLKDEYPKDYIKEFVAIRSKLYGLTCNSGKFVLKCKGIPRMNAITMESLKHNLKENLAEYGQHNQIMSKNHILGTFSITKKILTNEEDPKRINILLDDGEEHERYVTVPHN